jgi:hypothetical protein
MPYALINFYKAKDLRSPCLTDMGFVLLGNDKLGDI